MNIKPKSIALLGIIGLLACAAVAYGNATDTVSNDPQPATTSPAESAAPALVVAEPRFEFGRVLEGTEVVHDFLIENRGTGALHIEQVRTG